VIDAGGGAEQDHLRRVAASIGAVGFRLSSADESSEDEEWVFRWKV
jgi:hypothetical protein